jgi:6-phosphogluconolactonase
MLPRIALVLALLTARAAAGVATFYIGTYTDHSTSEGIYVDTLDTATGQLGTLKLAAPEKNPNFLALSPDHQFLFAALSNSVESFRVQPDTTLKPLNLQPSGAPDVCHISIDHTGRALFAASYDGGEIASFPVGEDGKIGDRAELIPFTGSGPKPRQKKPFAHSIYADLLNSFVYACDLGTDNVWSFKLGPGATLTRPHPPPR